MQGRRNGFGRGGGQNVRGKLCFYIKLTQFCPLVYLSICDFQKTLSYHSILALFIYTYLYVTISKTLFFWLAKYLGLPPPCSHAYGYAHAMVFQSNRL